MALDFNVDPYYDDFDQTKNYHRVLFRPGRAVQARELTQSQTILQDQITKFADNIFKQNSPVTGGQLTTNFNCYYIKLRTTYNNTPIDITKWYSATKNEGLLITNSDGSVVARVLQAVPASGSNPPTLIVSYKSGTQFTDSDIIFDVNSELAVQAIDQNSTGLSSVASISEGVFYILGNFVQIQPSTIVVDAYDNTPSRRIGLTITETVYDYIDDASILDPAVGASNYQAPGADRYYIGIELDSRPIQFGDDQNFVELARIMDGSVQKLVDSSVYNVIDDYFAKRDFETNGDYVVNDFKITPKVSDIGTEFTLSVGKGLAYVHGYRVENNVPVDLTVTRARSTANLTNNPVSIDFGPYFYVDNIHGGNSAFFNTGTTQTIDLHCVDSANVNVASASYSTTLVGSGYIRGLVYDTNTSSNANTYVYKAYVQNITHNSPSANASAGSANTITLPATYSKADGTYVGVTISITNGPSAGDFRTITAYNGSTKVATVNQNWSTSPTSSSVFTLNFDTKDIDSIVSKNESNQVIGKAEINTNIGRVNGSTVLFNANSPELIFNVGNPYVSSLTSANYTAQLVLSASFNSYLGGVQATIPIPSGLSSYVRYFGSAGHNLSASQVQEYFTIINLSTGLPVSWTESGFSATVGTNASSIILTATSASGVTVPFNATVIATVYVNNADDTGHVLRTKTLVEANTTTISNAGTGTVVDYYTYVDNTSSGQIYIQKAGLLGPNQKQSLYLTDVKKLIKIIDTQDSGTIPSSGMFNSPSYDVTANYTFDNGQRDTFYDHASITLKPGAPLPKGNILVYVDYYQHSGGDGYFSINSYASEPNYMEIPTYRSSSGNMYSLRDAVDFRPTRVNAQQAFAFQYSGASNTPVGTLLPVDGSIFNCDYYYYLGRKDKLVLTKDRSLLVVEGSPSVTPLAPTEPDGSLVLANLIHDPYTGYIPTEVPVGGTSNLSVERVQHKRYTMQDISNIEKRINNIEYYSSLNMLEQKTTTLQIPDAYGLNRFKNGILVDDFSSYGTADTYNIDYNASINRREKTLTAAQNVQNFPFKSLALNYSLNNLSSSINLGYNVSSDGYTNYFTLPYTTANVASQKFAGTNRTVNLNPFSVTTSEGTMAISPNMDNWVDTKYNPSLLITDPTMQVFQAGTTVNALTVGDWKTTVGTTTVTDTINHTSQNWGYGVGVGKEVVSTPWNSQQGTSYYGTYNNIGSTYALNNGYVTDITILPYIRAQQIVVRAYGMLFNTPVNVYFDGENVDTYFHKANILELTGVTGTFNEDDVIGYLDNSSTFHTTARVLGVYNKGSGNVRLYVAADGTTTTYTTGTVQNAKFDASGHYVVGSSTASGTLSSTKHFGGRVSASTGSTITLSTLASSVDNYYNGKTIYINTGSGISQSATIQSYVGSTRVATLNTSIGAAAGDLYSIGTVTTDETGDVYGVFNLPENKFHTGQRVLRIDNSQGNTGLGVTYCQGTFYAEGLQTTQQGLDFGASPAGAKNVIGVSGGSVSGVVSVESPWDPVAQTFIVDVNNYPNGVFLDSVSFFFRSKPLSDNSPVTLSIVGTLNGYPTGESLDHSVVTLAPDEIKVSETPQYLDTTTKTTFKFNAPIYIQPGVLYAFVLKSKSKEYTLWSASNGDVALKSSTKNYPSDATPSVATKIGSAPYVGGIFLSQNSQTWTADQNQSLMFVLDRCVFDTTSNPTITYTVPKKLPQRTLFNQSLTYVYNANNVSNTADAISNTDIIVDAFNITTTDFVPTTTNIDYTYRSTLVGGSTAKTVSINPGKFGTPTPSDLYLDDGFGERVLLNNSDSSLTLNAVLSTQDNAVSPVISDAGLSAYTIKWNINNGELSNSLITVSNGGTGYSNNNTGNVTVTISAPDFGANQAYGTANVVNGKVDAVYITQSGAGYITTPTVTINDANTTPGSGAVIVVAGETSPHGGNHASKYVTKKVVLDQGLDSGDLNVYLTAYRPVNTNINVYYKILSRNDTQKFEDSSWQLMTPINNSGGKYSSNRNDLIEYTFAPGTNGFDQGYASYTSSSGVTYNNFSQFAIKVTLTTPDSTSVPVIYDLRAIALPPNVNTSF